MCNPNDTEHSCLYKNTCRFLKQVSYLFLDSNKHSRKKEIQSWRSHETVILSCISKYMCSNSLYNTSIKSEEDGTLQLC